MSELKRTLGLSTAISIVIGGIIGSGIFMKPAVMASQLGSPLLLLSVWIVAGIVTIFGALSNAEVAAMFPETGGQYVFFKKMYGDGFAFLYGWAAFSVFNTAGNASIVYICAQYTDYFLHLPRLPVSTEHSVCLHIPGIGNIFPLENIYLKLLTVLLLALLTAINYYSVRYSAAMQRFLTFLKVGAIALLVTGIFCSPHGSLHNITTTLPHMPEGFALVSAYMAAIAGAFWAYDGWNSLMFIAGEIQHPQRNIPKSLFTGLLFCTITYAIMSLSFSYIMPVDKMAASPFIASDAAGAAWGAASAGIIALMVVLSTFGTSNAGVLATARVTYAMSDINKLFVWAGKTQPKYHTPGNALWMNAAWSTVLIFTGSFDTLTDMLVFVSWFFYGMSALGVIILRFKLKETPRPYKVWGYPVVPVLFVLFTAFFLSVTVYTDITNYQQGKVNTINSVMGAVITSIGLPIYFFWKRKPRIL